MDFALTPEQDDVREAIRKLCERFTDDFWLERDRDGVFPHAFFEAVAQGGWLGIAMPTEHGGAGLGITAAAVMMQTIAESGACMSGCSAVHLPVFGLQPAVLFGTDAQKARMLPPVI
ncbi:MAG: acyl-CoA dehydrogenase family protein, partial [Parvularculaceae bacterium]|nr:acyl-CoA dehydrogenase family protein [Parvularculaceae bacterium]